MEDVRYEYGIAANVVSDKVLRVGSKAFIVSYHPPHGKVCGISKKGRRLEKWIAFKRLEKFRAKWIPDHLRDRICLVFCDKIEAQNFADDLQKYYEGLRFYKKNGEMLREGDTLEQRINKLKKANDSLPL